MPSTLNLGFSHSASTSQQPSAWAPFVVGKQGGAGRKRRDALIGAYSRPSAKNRMEGNLDLRFRQLLGHIGSAKWPSVPSDKKAKRVLAMYKEGLSYRLIGCNVGLSKNQ